MVEIYEVNKLSSESHLVIKIQKKTLLYFDTINTHGFFSESIFFKFR